LLQTSHGAVSQAPHYGAALTDPEALYASPMEVIADPLLTADEKRAFLRNSADEESFAAPPLAGFAADTVRSSLLNSAAVRRRNHQRSPVHKV
jgi:hypothetical protein